MTGGSLYTTRFDECTCFIYVGKKITFVKIWGGDAWVGTALQIIGQLHVSGRKSRRAIGQFRSQWAWPKADARKQSKNPAHSLLE